VAPLQLNFSYCFDVRSFFLQIRGKPVCTGLVQAAAGSALVVAAVVPTCCSEASLRRSVFLCLGRELSLFPC